MIRWALRALDKVERDGGYGPNYTRDMIDASPAWLGGLPLAGAGRTA